MTDLKTKLEGIRKEYLNVSSLPESISGLQSESKELVLKIKNKFSKLEINDNNNNEWRIRFEDLKKNQKSIENEIEEKQLELARLNIPEEMYMSEPSSEMYNQQKFNGIKSQNGKNMTLNIKKLTENYVIYDFGQV